jgi:hypothetical protein
VLLLLLLPPPPPLPLLLLQAALQEPNLLALLTLALREGDKLADHFGPDSLDRATDVSHFLLTCLDSVYSLVSSTVPPSGTGCGQDRLRTWRALCSARFCGRAGDLAQPLSQ